MQISLSTTATAAGWGATALQRGAAASNASSGGGDGGFAVEGGRPPGPPPGPPPAEASLTEGMSTEAFARCCGGGAAAGGKDPVAALDADDDDSVSAEEFGLADGDDDALQALFDAMDADGDGSLSGTEMEDFRETFMAQLTASDQDLRPPAPHGSGSDFVRELANVYASMQASTQAQAESGMSVTA